MSVKKDVCVGSYEAAAGAGRYQQCTRGNLPRAAQLSTTDALIMHAWTPIALRGNINKSTFLLSTPDALAESTECTVVPHGINDPFWGRLYAGSQSEFRETWVPLMQGDAEAFFHIGSRWSAISCLSDNCSLELSISALTASRFF